MKHEWKKKEKDIYLPKNRHVSIDVPEFSFFSVEGRGNPNDDFAEEIIDRTKKKKPHELLDNVRFESIAEGRCVQMLHLGPYDTEPESFRQMEDYCVESGLKRASKTHREIYISDVRKTAPENLKTVLRFRVE